MKTKTSESKKVDPTLHTTKNSVELDSFEEDWKNGISGEEFVARVHVKIKEWWHANRESKSS
jgi:hypothetical protein